MNSLGKLKQIYQKNSLIHLPVYRLTRSKSYTETLSFLKESERWPKEKMDEWSLNQIQRIVDYAITHVTYYRDVYRSVGLESGHDIVRLSDFEKLPTISKSIIKENFEAFCSDEPELKRRNFCTSGTSMPFSFYLDESYVGREQAYFDYYWSTRGGVQRR